MSNDINPRNHSENPAAEAERGDEALGRLEARLDRASEAAERLIADAAARIARPSAGDADPSSPQTERKIPPAGWQRPAGPSAQERPGADEEAAGNARSSGEFEVLLHALGALRDRIPPELQHRLGEALREVLLALRALIDWYLERTERRRAAPTEVQDIPIL